MADEATPKTSDNSGLLARLGAKVGRQTDQIRALTAERDALKAERETLAKERNALKAAGDSATAREVERLKGEIRLGKHRAKFDELAKAVGANPKALDDVYAASGWKADGDAIDEAGMTAAIGTAKAAKDYLFVAPTTTTTTTTTPAPKPAPGAGKGGTSQTGAPGFPRN